MTLHSLSVHRWLQLVGFAAFVVGLELLDFRALVAFAEAGGLTPNATSRPAIPLNIVGLAIGWWLAYLAMESHPLIDDSLRSRLQVAGWRSDRAYPFGSIPPTWGDLLLIGIAIAYCATLSIATAIAVPIGALATWVLQATRIEVLSVASIRSATVCTAVLAIAGLLLTYIGATSTLVWLAITATVAVRGARDLDRHLDDLDLASFEASSARPFTTQAIRENAGYPHAVLTDVGEPLNTPHVRLTIAAVALLWAWVVLAVAASIDRHATQPDDRWVPITIGLLFPYLAIAFWRVLRRVGVVASPIAFADRLRTGRLILPKYDVGFLPGAVAIVLLAMWIVAVSTVVESPFLQALLFAVITFAMIACPPRRDEYLLTGTGRPRKPSQVGAAARRPQAA